MQKLEIEKKIIDYLIKFDEIKIAYLFGSFVKSDYFHDIDIAVYIEDNYNYRDFKKYPFGYESYFIGNLCMILKTDVDFLIMNNADITLQQRIINTGKLLFSKNEKFRIHYENYVRKIYIDLQPLRQILSYYLNKKLLNAR